MTPPVWTNQDIILYHGTLDVHVSSILSGIDVTKGRPRVDFGRGFYTTTNEDQAKKWSEILQQRTLIQQPSGQPPPGRVVIRFTVSRDALAQLDALWFVRGTTSADDYWSLVFYCRKGGSAHGRSTKAGWYDVVVGPVADARWSQRRLLPNSDQISFHTSKGAKLLDSTTKRVFIFQADKWTETP